MSHFYYNGVIFATSSPLRAKIRNAKHLAEYERKVSELLSGVRNPNPGPTHTHTDDKA